MKTDTVKKKRVDRKKASIMYNVPVKDRQAKGVRITCKKLRELGFKCDPSEKRPQDKIAVKDGYRIPIQAKPLPLTRTTNMTCVANSALEDFTGLYIIWVEQLGRESDYLHIPDEIFRSIVYERGYQYESVGKKNPHKKRWWLYIPRSLNGFEQFADDTIPDRYRKDKEKLLRELKRLTHAGS